MRLVKFFKAFVIGFSAAIIVEILVRGVIFLEYNYPDIKQYDLFQFTRLITVIYCPFLLLPGKWLLSEFWPLHVLAMIMNGIYYTVIFGVAQIWHRFSRGRRA